MIEYIEKLLNGRPVEWKKIEDISKNICSGGTPRSYVPEYYGGDIPWLRTQEVNFSEIWDTEVKITKEGLDSSNAKYIPANCIIVAMYGATVGRVGINKIPLTTNQACANIEVNEDIVYYKYLFYYLSSQYEYIKSLGAGTQTNINAGIVKNLIIPIPPLGVQREIVRILDRFTMLESELEEKLGMELECRRKQYGYYMDKLLSEGYLLTRGKVEWKTLGEVADYEQPTKYLVNSTNYNDNYSIPVLTAGKTFILGYTDETTGIYKASLKPVIIFDDFTTDIKWVNFDFKAKSSAMKMITSKSENVALLKFIYYWLCILPKDQSVENHKRHWIGDYSTRSIPIPPLEVQEEVVRILDRFDVLTNSISEGLPREIELRRKQYEYYRERLLNFPR